MKPSQLRELVILAALLLFKVQCQPPGLQLFESTSACHGTVATETKINATCNTGQVIAANDITMGAKPTSSGCPLYYNSTLGYDTCCTHDANDCTFPFFVNNQYHEQCNGELSCDLGTQHQDILNNCDTLNDTFGAEGRYSNYLFMTFYCVEDDKMVEMCSGQNSPLTKENTEVYIWNRDFPTSGIQSTDSSCGCSVEIDNCEAGINIYTMYRQLTGDTDDVCNQTLRVGENGNDTVLYEWSCIDNMLDFETNTVQETYILLNLENQRNETDGKFWLGFKATADSNITVSCPPETQQYCIPTTTTSPTTTTTTSITTTTNATENTTTTTEATTTPTTTPTATTTENTTTSTTSVTSTTTSVSTNETTAEIISPVSTDDSGIDLLVVVVVLAVLAALLLIAVIVVACCLHRTCRRANNENDAEKVIYDKSQPTPHKETETDLRPVIASPPLSTFVSAKIPIQLVDSGCQVSLAPLKADTSDFICQAEIAEQKPDKQADTPPPLQLVDKGTNTLPPSLTHFLCQTDSVRTKSQKVQININPSPSVATASCQTDVIVHKGVNKLPPKSPELLNKTAQDEKKEELLVSPRTMRNGTISVPPVSDEIPKGTETLPQKTESFKHTSRGRQHKHRKKKRKIHISDIESDVQSGYKSPVNLESIKPEFKQESLEKEETFDDERDEEVSEETNGDIRTIHVVPESSTPNIPTEVNHVLKMRNTIAYSFFGKERLEEKILRLVSKSSKGQKNKKAIRKGYSEC